jgi:hypothetical protein
MSSKTTDLKKINGILRRFWLSCFDRLVFLFPKSFIFFWICNLLTMNIPDEGFSRNVSCARNQISTFLLNIAEFFSPLYLSFFLGGRGLWFLPEINILSLVELNTYNQKPIKVHNIIAYLNIYNIIIR